MPVSPARAAALEILLRIEKTDAYSSELLHSQRFAKLSPADHGLLTELVMGVLRWRGVLDDHIAQHLTQPLGKLDLAVLTALRLGGYQLLFLDRIPKHAAVNDSVELVKQARKRSAAGMVNAVLRKVAKSSPKNSHTSEQHQVDTHPEWLVKTWTNSYGAEVTKQICDYDQRTPKITVRTSDPGQVEGLHHDGVRLKPGRFLAKAFVVEGGDVTRTKAFRDRRLTIQDEASQLVALLVGKGTFLLDCCAAPGGKTRILAEQNPNSTVIAMELHSHRASLLRKLTAAVNIQVVAAAARQIPLAMKFDRVLVDAPCSGTGTLARNPEIKWRLKPEDLSRLQGYQTDILVAAMNQVAPGGRLVYSTCSLEPEESSMVIEKALAASSLFRVIDCRDELRRLRRDGEFVTEDIESLLNGPYLRTIPGVHSCDGFFAAVLEKSP